MSATHNDAGNRPLKPTNSTNPMYRHHSRDDDAPTDSSYARPSIHDLYNREFYQKEGWFEALCEALFKIKNRGTTIKAEAYHGVVHFISCLYCLAVVPQQMSSAGYDGDTVVVAVALLCGVGSIFCGLFANLPFVLAPPTVVTIFLSVYLQQNGIGPHVGNYASMISGFALMFFFWRPLGEFVKHLIPIPIQVGTVVGIGLLTTLAGSTEIDFVLGGHYTILRMGHITSEVVITFTGVLIVCVALHWHITGSFCLAVLFCSIVYWIVDDSFPSQYVAVPRLTTADFSRKDGQSDLPLLTIDLLFLYVLYLNGLLTSLSNLAVLTRKDKSIPRGRWIFILCGFFTLCSGLLTTAPILVSPESAAAIKEGAKTGLSTVVCGVLFLFASFFSPLFKNIPPAGTSPVLIMIGLVLFQNVGRIDWRNVAEAAPAFVVLFYIPFTYSVIQGVILGYVMYLCITLCTGELLQNALFLVLTYFPEQEENLRKYPRLIPYLPQELPEGEEALSEREGSLASECLSEGSATLGVTSGLGRSESTAGGTDTLIGVGIPSAVTMGSGGTGLTAGTSSKKVKGSAHDQESVLEAFANMGTMSFSGPSEQKPPARPKLTKTMSARMQRFSDANTPPRALQGTEGSPGAAGAETEAEVRKDRGSSK